MTLKTLGMGIAKLATKTIKKAKAGSGKVIKRAKEDAPFYGMVGSVVAGRHIYHKARGKKTDWDIIKESAKKKRKKNTSVHKEE